MVVLKAKEDAREEVEAFKIMVCVTILIRDRCNKTEKVKRGQRKRFSDNNAGLG